MQLNKTILSLLLVALASFEAGAATLWVNPAGSSTAPYDTKLKGITTIAAGLSAMSGGDTLIIADGTYTGNSNMIHYYLGNVIPAGSVSAWTTVQAENDGGVVLDGQGSRAPVYIRGNDLVESTQYDGATQQYITLRGIISANSSASGIDIRGSNHIKIINCGSYDSADGNTWGIGAMYSTYILFEGCYSWGGSRYKFGLWHGHYTIFRNCVSRSDYVDANSDPAAGYAMYSSTNVEVQNSIDIDGDDATKWIDVNEYAGSFAAPATSAVVGYTGVVRFTNCIALNNATRFGSSDNNAYAATAYWTNSVGWDLRPRSTNGAIRAFGNGYAVNNTFGDIQSETSSGTYHMNGYQSTQENRNNIWYSLNGSINYAVETSSNNVFSSVGTVDAYNTTSTSSKLYNPLTSGLMYLPRIEASSQLATDGIGATLMYQYGATGTLYGETGYATLTSTPMWPYPNQDLIKTKMAAYSNHSVNGSRGFAASGTQLNGTDQITLTSYIWEYLGNQMPTDLYGETDPLTCYQDADNDLYGHGVSQQSQNCPSGYYVASHFTALTGDCADTDQTINPGGTDICGQTDRNCNGTIDPCPSNRVRFGTGSVGWGTGSVGQ